MIECGQDCRRCCQVIGDRSKLSYTAILKLPQRAASTGKMSVTGGKYAPSASTENPWLAATLFFFKCLKLEM
jgi:hypothetical protein